MGGCMLKVKKAKKMKVVTKGLKEMKVTLDKVQELLKRKHCKCEQKRSRSYSVIAYLMKHGIKFNKVYTASQLLAGNDSSTHYIGSTTRDSIKKVFPQIKEIVAIAKKDDNKNLFTSLKLTK